MKTAYQHIEAAVAEVLPQIPPDELKRHPPAAVVSSRLFAYIHAATSALLPDVVDEDDLPEIEEKSDKRAKPWQIQVRFWDGEELVAETDPEVIDGTGEIAPMVAAVATDLHEVLPNELSIESVKKLLPQLRNNLARQKAATLRIKYEAADLSEDQVFAGRAVQYMCQVDVFRLS